ncbi:hypothetical protein QQG74_09415 [Micromonospora sp. FIMYZ51]|uniref:hypothetical protein n=1 Tax=Micromonospora sp. FIMYZ51 TaxID=3051832 RepID=UPI00311F0E8F
MYLLLASQPDISAAGVLPLSLTRWASRAQNSTRESVVAALNELQESEFVCFDVLSEELLVRTFIEWDGAHRNPKRKPAILAAAHVVESLAIRRALATDLHRLRLPTRELDLSPQHE